MVYSCDRGLKLPATALVFPDSVRLNLDLNLHDLKPSQVLVKRKTWFAFGTHLRFSVSVLTST